MIGVLNKNQVEKVLQNQVLGRIGCHADGTTYIVPICYAYEDGVIYGRSNNGMKVDIMRKNPSICFEVEDVKDLANWRTVILWGRFVEITETEERNKALQKLLQRQLPIVSGEMARFTPNWPFDADNVEEIEGVVYKIEISEKSGRFENYQGIDEVSQPFL